MGTILTSDLCFLLNVRLNRCLYINMKIILAFWPIFAANFLKLCPMAINPNSIETLSSPRCVNLVKRLLDFIWPNTASTSMERLLLYTRPFSLLSISRARPLSSFSLWFISIFRLSCPLWHNPRMGHP